MKARIYPISRNTMQSGLDKAGIWVLEYELESQRKPDPLMGWSSSGDTLNQIRLKFDTSDEAEAFAKSKGWEYTTSKQHVRKVTPRNYVENFKYVEPIEAER